MNDMNCCSFTGRLCADPELHTFPSGTQKVTFRVAVNSSFKKGEEWVEDPSFLTFEAWAEAAERISNTYKKGDFILISDASIRTERWEAKDSGEKREKLVFRCNRFQLLPGQGRRDNDGGDVPQSEDAPKAAPKAASKRGGKQKPDAPAAEGGDEDIPF